MARKKLKWSDMRPSEKRDHVIYLIGQILKWLFVGSMCIFTLYPVVYTLLGSFKTNAELTLGGNFLPENWQFNNYVYAFQKLDFGKYFLNSVVLALLTVVFTLITSSMAAYVISRRDFVGKKLISTAYLLSMFISVGSVALYPLYTLMSRLGLTKNMVGLALMLTGGQAANIFMISGFINGVPKDLDEAATIDGAGPFRIFWQILLPLMKPALFSASLFQFLWTYNDYFNSLIFINSVKKYTISLALRLSVDAESVVVWGRVMAMACVAVLPLVLLFFAAQKYFVEGIATSGLKG